MNSYDFQALAIKEISLILYHYPEMQHPKCFSFN